MIEVTTEPLKAYTTITGSFEDVIKTAISVHIVDTVANNISGKTTKFTLTIHNSYKWAQSLVDWVNDVLTPEYCGGMLCKFKEAKIISSTDPYIGEACHLKAYTILLSFVFMLFLV